MTSTAERIAALSSDQVLEAVNLLSGELLGATPDDEIRLEIAARTCTTATELDCALAASGPTEVAALGRVVLTEAAGYGYATEVEDALDQIGEKALLIEITVIGLLALGVIHMLRTGGKKEERREEEVTLGPDGKLSVKTSSTVTYYSLGESLAPFAEKLLKIASGG